MSTGRLNRTAAILPLVFSGLAFTIVMANILAGVRPQTDENASAHLWQMLMAAQIPLTLLFVATADWHKRSAFFLVLAQLLGIAMACLPVWLAGY